MNEQLESLRLQINAVDEKLCQLFSARMDLVAAVAKVKEASGLPIFDPVREAQVLDRVSQRIEEEKSNYLRQVYQCLMDVSKAYEKEKMVLNPLPRLSVPKAFPQVPRIACQGVPGAFSAEAAGRMFAEKELYFVPGWEDAFQAVTDGICDFAVLPVENSFAGSVGQVYDLLLKNRLSIVKACRLPVEQNLLALPGACLDDITEIYSHPQALAQCKPFCDGLVARTIPLDNTAAAAKMVAGLQDIHKAAIASSYCAEIYGLQILAPHIQFQSNNTTRFVAVAREAYQCEDANKISIAFSLPHEPGALFHVLAHFASTQLNLSKIESRPIKEEGFDYEFYLDFSGNTSSDAIRRLIHSLAGELPDFRFLGNYQELS